MISSIDGEPLRTAQQLLDLFARLEQVSSVELGGTRAGKLAQADAEAALTAKSLCSPVRQRRGSLAGTCRSSARFLPPYDPLDWVKRPFPERARMVCEAWALQGYGAPLAVYVLYAVKLALYVGAWVLFCGFTPGLGGLATIGDWWLHPIAFQKAILWSMLFEGLGLGCGSGPLTGRYFPPDRRRSSTSCAPARRSSRCFAALPLLGGTRRTWLDVALYVALLALLVRALLVAALDAAQLLVPIAVLVPLLGVARSRRSSSPLRAEHYWTTIVVLRCSPRDWIAGRQGGAARALVLGRRLEAQPPLPDGRLRDDEQQPVHALRVAAAAACTAAIPDDLAPVAARDRRWATPARRSSSACRSCSLLGAAARSTLVGLVLMLAAPRASSRATCRWACRSSGT